MADFTTFAAFFVLITASNGLKMPVGDPITAIEGLVSRILGKEYVSRFVFEVISPDLETGHDVFEIDANSTLKKPVLRGNNGVALASAFNFYLKYDCMCSISWGRDGTGDQLNVPHPLPLPTFKRMVSPVKYRYYQNVCTVSYSMAWWNFSRWEREIDWMAMNGLNLILSFTGQEYIWQKFYSHIGVNNSAIKSFFSGPAFLAWQRMGNIKGWGGPLDDGWIESQAYLQKQIMSRIREFGMINVLPGFAGHVPAALKDLYPNAGFSQNEGWLNFNFNSTYSNNYLLQPNDTLFKQLGKIYYQMLIDEYGSDHVFNCDTYNEMDPDSTNLTYLANVNRAIYETMYSVDQEAVFLMQGWLFHSGFWKKHLYRIRAFLSGVPDDRMIILDLSSERIPLWKKTRFYFGKPFVWCLLHNFGGTRAIYGNLTTIATNPVRTLHTPGSTMVGVGMTPEAIEQNPVVYDLMGEMSWRSEEVTNLMEWITQYSERRYGNFDSTVLQAWTTLLNGPYQFHWSWSIKGMIERVPDFSIPYYSAMDPGDITVAWWLLVEAAQSGSINQSVGPVQYDLVDLGRQMLVNLFVDLHSMYVSAYNMSAQHGVNTSKQLVSIQSAMLKLFDDLDRLLASNTNFLFGHWIADARASVPNTSPPEAVDNAEFNARNQVTMWGPDENIDDYASKEWAGLVKDYYKKRWALFTDLVNKAVIENVTFNRDAYESARHQLEKSFSFTIKSYPTTPVGNPVDISYQLLSYLTKDIANYSTYYDTDVDGNNLLITPTWNLVPGQLAYLCNVHPDCVGFNSHGYLKTSVSKRVHSEGTTLFVKQSQA